MPNRFSGNKIVVSTEETIPSAAAGTALATGTQAERYLFQASFSNAGSIFLGLENACFLELRPGDTLEWDIDKPSDVFARSTNGTDKLTIVGRR